MGKQRYVIRHGRRIAVRTIYPGGKRKHQRVEPFVKVPLQWATKAAKATNTKRALVWIWLLHRRWKTRSSTFPLSNNGLQEKGVSRFVKRQVLRELEIAGLIVVERLPGRAPTITLVN